MTWGEILALVVGCIVFGFFTALLVLSLIYYKNVKKYENIGLVRCCSECGMIFADYDVSDYIYCPMCGFKLDKMNLEVKTSHAYCEKCNCDSECLILPHKHIIKDFQDKYFPEGIDICFNGKIAVCKICGEEVFLDEVEEYNQEQFEIAYQKEKDLPF